MQPFQLINQKGTNEVSQVRKLKKLKKIDFSKAYHLCLNELEDKKTPTVLQLHEWLKSNGLVLEPKNFLETIYNKGIEHEKSI